MKSKLSWALVISWFGVALAGANPDDAKPWKLPGLLEPIAEVDGCESLEHLQAIAKQCDGSAEVLSEDVLSILCFYGSGIGFGEVSIFVRHEAGAGQELSLAGATDLEIVVAPFVRLLTSPMLLEPNVTLAEGSVVIRGDATHHGHETRITLEVGEP